jgi:hypothetical protein
VLNARAAAAAARRFAQRVPRRRAAGERARARALFEASQQRRSGAQRSALGAHWEHALWESLLLPDAAVGPARARRLPACDERTPPRRFAGGREQAAAAARAALRAAPLLRSCFERATLRARAGGGAAYDAPCE